MSIEFSQVRETTKNKQPNSVTRKLKEFLHTLELLIHDLNIEVKYGKKLKIYFDAPDIANAIEGISIFYDYSFTSNKSDLEFNKELFSSRKTLVSCLAVSGMIGKINLLLPHQGELSRIINRLSQFGTNIDIPPSELAERFLENTDFEDFKWQRVSQKESLIKKAIRELPSNKAKVFFKTVQFLKPWYNRLIDMIDNGILETSESLHYQPSNMIELLFELKESLDQYKPGYSNNNYIDSLALGTLIEEINRYKNGKSNEIPCFFSSEYTIFDHDEKKHIKKTPSTFYKVASDPKFINYFTYGDTKKVSVIRDDNYFIFRATFAFRRNSKELLEELQEWHQQVEEILKTTNLTDIDTRSLNNQDWVNLIDERDNDTFFKNVWLNSDVPVNIYNKAIQEIIKASEKVRQADATKIIADRRVRLAVEKWRNQAELASDIVSMWKELDRRLKKWRNIEKFKGLEQEELEQEIFKEFGFFRYSFPPETRSKITDNLKDLLEGGNAEKEARRRILSYYVQSHETKEIDTSRLAIVTSSLLVLERNRDLKKILKKALQIKKDNPLHFSFKIIYGKLLLDTDSKMPIRQSTCSEINKIINELVYNYNREKNYLEKNRLAIGIAYLYYWLWIGQGGQATWRKHWKGKRKKNPELESLIQLAIKYAKNAYLTLDKFDSKTIETSEVEYLEIVKTYALNMYLYHLVEEDRLIKKRELIDTGKKLSQYENNKHVWQYRFDDTLAVCYAKLALIENNDRSRKDFYFDLANMHINKALNHIKNIYGDFAFEGRDKDVKEHEVDIDLLKKRILSKNQQV